MPPHWNVRPLRLIGRLLKGSGGSKEDAVEEGVPCVRYGELYTTHRNFIERALSCVTRERASDYTPIEFGDVLFAASGETIEDIGKSAVNLLHGARCGGDVVILRPTDAFVPRFLGYATDAAPVAAQKSLAGRGSTVKHIYPDELREVVIAVPPVDEQQAIANFLDRETGRLDALVAVKQRLIDLLAEKRRAIIATAMTRGLDPKVKLRDSCVPWLGEIPAHWELWKVGHLAKVGNGSTPDRDKVAYWNEGSFPWLNSSVVNHEEVTSSDQFVTDAALRECHLPRLRPGTVLVAITGQGKTRGQSVVLSIEATINQHMAFVAPNPALVDAWFLRWSFYRAYEYLRSISDDAGGTKGALTCEDVAGLRIPVPPPDEQRTIVEHIARETARLDAVRAATERTIALLKERRTALIAAAVTGQLDVGVAA
ncbi:MAG: restriction endonuclease subunit S [Phycisphaerales bacterium]